MNWEHTDPSMAPRAGRVDELRNEAASYRQSRDLIKKRRSRRAQALRAGLGRGLAALPNLIARSRNPQEHRPPRREGHVQAATPRLKQGEPRSTCHGLRADAFDQALGRAT